MLDTLRARTWGETVRACGDQTFAAAAADRGAARAVFLDRDGTLIVDHPYSADTDAIELLPGVVDGLVTLHDAGYLLIVVTNQSGIARGYFDDRALAAMHYRLNQLLALAGVDVAAYYYCPHHVAGREPTLARPCGCRKPSPGMLLRAAVDWSIDLGQSWLIGDRASDAAAALAAGCQPLLVGPGPWPHPPPLSIQDGEGSRTIPPLHLRWRGGEGVGPRGSGVRLPSPGAEATIADAARYIIASERRGRGHDAAAGRSIRQR